MEGGPRRRIAEVNFARQPALVILSLATLRRGAGRRRRAPALSRISASNAAIAGSSIGVSPRQDFVDRRDVLGGRLGFDADILINVTRVSGRHRMAETLCGSGP